MLNVECSQGPWAKIRTCGLPPTCLGTTGDLNLILATLAVLSLVLLLWQWLAAWRFPLHQRVNDKFLCPGGDTVETAKRMRCSDGRLPAQLVCSGVPPGELQILFGVASASDPVCEIVRRLIRQYPGRDAELILCERSVGANAKVSQLVGTGKVREARGPGRQRRGRQSGARFSDQCGLSPFPEAFGRKRSWAREFLLSSRQSHDARDGMGGRGGQFRFLEPGPAIEIAEAAGFALGAVMITRRKQLAEIGGFRAFADGLADDYQLGNLIARRDTTLRSARWSSAAGIRQ